MTLRTHRVLTTLAISTALALGAAACGEDEATTTQSGGDSAAEELSGTIKIDGSSTVFPFAQAAAELFSEQQPEVQVTVGQSGTGGGFEKFCAGETDISNASRPIRPDEEVPLCEKAGVGFAEIHVANDGIAVATSKSLPVECLTTAQLEQLWDKGSAVRSLADVDPELPATELSLYGPGTDSGTFDFFTNEVNGEEGRSRDDYQASEDDNQLVTGVANDEGGLGYFGFSYFEANEDKLNLVAIDGGDGCVEPSLETIQDGSYEPLSRPIFMYPSKQALARPEVKAFMNFIVENREQIAEAARIIPLTDEQAAKAADALKSAEAGA